MVNYTVVKVIFTIINITTCLQNLTDYFSMDFVKI